MSALTDHYRAIAAQQLAPTEEQITVLGTQLFEAAKAESAAKLAQAQAEVAAFEAENVVAPTPESPEIQG